MNRDDSVKLFLECEAKRGEARAAALAGGKSEDEAHEIAHEAAKTHWNGWADGLLAERKAMQADGCWAAWIQKAKADFSSCLFETPSSLRVHGSSSERETETPDRGSKAPRDDGAEDGEAPRRSIKLEGNGAYFSGFIFPGDANFQSATFCGNAEFKRSRFLEAASFEGAIFKGKTRFTYARFRRQAAFNNAGFRREAWFDSVGFKMTTRYDGVSFHDIAAFAGAAFSSHARFDRAIFATDAFFERTSFEGEAWFVSAVFAKNVLFNATTFGGSVSFDNTTFKGDTSFYSVAFSGDAGFENAVFSGSTSFARATFRESASFCAIVGNKGFDMANTKFNIVPVFIQAHFEEAPRLDNLAISRQWWWRADSDFPSRWRSLKRLAILGHDSDRELEFHARELCSQRFTEDWPLPLQRFGKDWLVPIAFWRGNAWRGFFRFWLGMFYGLFSNFGRSLGRPFIASGLAAIAAAAFYLSQTEVMQRELALRNLSYLDATVQTARYALDNKVRCYPPPPTAVESWRGQWPWWRKALKIDPNASRVDDLTPKFQNQTNARAEAWHLAFRNAFIVLDGSSEAAHRTYGCLYGVELYGGSNPLAVVPSAVSTASAIQKLFSALMIFLFGLALRNMLKMK
jgi:Pentapeptide repeats (9 copies)